MSDNKQETEKTAEQGGQVDVIVSGDGDGKLSPEQIENWRRILCEMLGPYALIASDAEIQKMRDKFQKRINSSR